MNIPELKMRSSKDYIKFLKPPYLIEAKLDGEYNMLTVGERSDDISLINKYGKIRRTLIFNKLPVNTILIGELVYGEGLFGDLYKLLAHKTDKDLRFYAFDILKYDNQDISRLSLEKRKKILFEIPVYHPLHSLAFNLDEINSEFNKYLSLNYEGIVIKSLNSTFAFGKNWIKLKSEITWDMKVEYIDTANDRIEVLLPNNKGTCGVKIISRYKKDLKPNDIVEIKHNGILKSGNLRHPVFIRKRHDKTEPSYA